MVPTLFVVLYKWCSKIMVGLPWINHYFYGWLMGWFIINALPHCKLYIYIYVKIYDHFLGDVAVRSR